jgi:hypothetical protein
MGDGIRRARSMLGDDERRADWRYRELDVDPSLLHPRLEERRFTPRSGSADVDLRGARTAARALLIAAILMPLALLAWWVAQPGFMGRPEPQWYQVALPWAGAAGYLLGLIWMIRIYRADPEPDVPSWRYRD